MIPLPRKRPTDAPLGLTRAEMDFIHHFRRESLALEVGPAREWFRSNGICESVMIPLLYDDQENNPRWLDRLYEDLAPEFAPLVFSGRVRATGLGGPGSLPETEGSALRHSGLSAPDWPRTPSDPPTPGTPPGGRRKG